MSFPFDFSINFARAKCIRCKSNKFFFSLANSKNHSNREFLVACVYYSKVVLSPIWLDDCAFGRNFSTISHTKQGQCIPMRIKSIKYRLNGDKIH